MQKAKYNAWSKQPTINEDYINNDHVFKNNGDLRGKRLWKSPIKWGSQKI